MTGLGLTEPPISQRCWLCLNPDRQSPSRRGSGLL